MSVMPVRKISLVGQAREANAVMATLQNVGLVHISALPIESIDAVHEQELTEQTELLAKLERAISGIKKHEASSSVIPPKCSNARESLPEVLALIDEIESSTNSIARFEWQMARCQPFGDFAQDLAPLKQAGIFLKLASITDAELASLCQTPVNLQVVSKTGEINHVAIFMRGTVDMAIATFDPPDESLSQIAQKLAVLKARRALLSAQCSRWYYQLRSFEKLELQARDTHDRLVELKKAQHEDQLFGISGFVLKEDAEALKKVLLHHLVAVRMEDVSLTMSVPVKLKNPKLIRGFETILRSFSGVNYFEMDKTKIVSLLFVVFGALCLLDSGYGILLFIFGYVLAIKKNKNFGQVFMWTGAAATALGLMCGQFFGLVFAKDILPTISPLLTLATDPMVCFKFSLIVGIFALALTNAVVICERGLASNATGNFLAVIAGLLLVANKNAVFVGQIDDYTPLVNNLSFALMGLAVIAWLIFPDAVFGEKSRIANILWTLYSGPVGLIQDILSHMRLFGIALSGAILALVVNKMAGLMPFLAGALFAPVGHFFVFLLSLLSLYIHTNRLIFLEFGSKCMSGGTDYFAPFCRRFGNEKNY